MRAGCRRWRRSPYAALAAKQRAVPGLADPHSVFQHGLEHRLELARRAADDAKHFGGRGLLLQQFAQLAEQAGVLDRDDGLLGEVGEELDLFLGERPDLVAMIVIVPVGSSPSASARKL